MVERKNRVVVEMARTLLLESKVHTRFWTEATFTAVHLLNRVLLKPNTDKTPYELWSGKKTTAKYLRVFGSPCFVKNKEQNLGKFNARSDEGIFVGYSAKTKGYRVFLHKLGKVITTSDVRIDENWKTMQNGEAEDNEEDDFNVDEESDQPEEKEQEVSLDSEKSESE